MSIKVAQNDNTRKMIDFDNFTKIAGTILANAPHSKFFLLIFPKADILVPLESNISCKENVKLQSRNLT